MPLAITRRTSVSDRHVAKRHMNYLRSLATVRDDRMALLFCCLSLAALGGGLIAKAVF